MNGKSQRMAAKTGNRQDKGNRGERRRGDAVFVENRMDYTSDPDNVIFTSADGKTKLTVPRTKILSVKFKDGCDIFSVTSVSNTIDIEFIGLTTKIIRLWLRN